MSITELLAVGGVVFAAGQLVDAVRGLKGSIREHGQRLGSLKEEVDYNRGYRDGLQEGRRETQERAGAT